MTDQQDKQAPHMSRRRLLKTAAVVGVGAVGASKLILDAAPAAAHGTLVPHNEIWGVSTFYQNLDTGGITGPTTYHYQANLYQKLVEWFPFYYFNTPSNYITGAGGAQICLNGVHVDNGSGMHPHGRAADISQITLYHLDYGFYFDAFNGRYNWWRNNPQMAEYRRRYWAVVAGLNIFFRHVLHYNYNSIHHNHVHVDNELSNGTYSQFAPSSTTQVKMVQSVLNYVFGMPTTINGSFNQQTDTNSALVLYSTGWSGNITTSQAHWHRFLKAAQRAGHGLPIDSGSMGVAAADARSGKPLPGGASK